MVAMGRSYRTIPRSHVSGSSVSNLIPRGDLNALYYTGLHVIIRALSLRENVFVCGPFSLNVFDWMAIDRLFEMRLNV